MTSFDPFMPGGTKMYHQRAKNSNLSDFDDTWQSSCMVMGSQAKIYKNLPSSLFLGINGLTPQGCECHICRANEILGSSAVNARFFYSAIVRLKVKHILELE